MKWIWKGPAGNNPILGEVFPGKILTIRDDGHKPAGGLKRMINSGLLKKQPGKPKPEAPQKTTVEEVK